jgi:7-carboxy-7-deazaguanine synthase
MQRISELFHSIQGEGNTTGQNAVFIRYNICNASCKDCDTPYTWRNIQNYSKDYSTEEIIQFIKQCNTKRVVFTGGEPIGVVNNFTHAIEIIDSLCGLGYNFEFETNGIVRDSNKQQIIDLISRFIPIFSDKCNVQFNISPKINFPQLYNNNTYPSFINMLQDIGCTSYIVKFLIGCDDDVDFIKSFANKMNINNNRIWIQPVGIDSDSIKNIAVKYFNAILENGWNLSMRNHIFLFGNKKGV